MNKQLRVTRLAGALALVLATSTPVFAQTTSAQMAGRVTSEQGEALAGAEVVIVHTPSGTTVRSTTDAEGRYTARGLRVGGPYTVTVLRPGFEPETTENVFLQLNEVTAVNVDLAAEATELEAVTVVGSAGSVFSPDRMGTSTQISRDQLDSFASIQRNLQDYARLDPRVSQTDKDRGEISVAGQNSRFNSITVDGVSISDTFGLEANNLPTQKQPISIDAIDAVQVNISNVDVTQKGYTGANINAVTKSGTNEFKGSVYYVWRDDKLAGDRYNRAGDSFFAPPASEDETAGITFGGPLIKDRLFFFLSYEDYKSTRVGSDFVPLGGTGSQVFITPEQVAQVRSIAQSRYGVDIGGIEAPTTAALTVEDVLFKLDWNISDSHRANLRYTKTEESNPIFPNNNGGNLSFSSHWYNQDKTIESLVGQWYADWSDNFSTEFRVSRREYDSQPINFSNLPQVAIQITGGTPPAGVQGGTRNLRFGTERSRHFNVLSTVTDDIFFAGNWYAGDHEVKAGFDWAKNDVYNAFLQDTNGTYLFGCIAAASCATSFESGAPLGYQVQAPQASQTLNNGVAEWELGNWGLFLQDTWAVNYNLSIVFGVRYDRTRMPDSPLFNSAAAAAPGALVNGRATGGFGLDNSTTLDGKGLFQPRLGMNYTFDTERATQLRAGIGLFEGSAANVWLSNPYSNTGRATQVVGCGNAGVGSSFASCPAGTSLFSPVPNQQVTNLGAPPASNVDFLSNDLRMPSVWKANIAFDHETPYWGAVFSAELLLTQTEHGIYYRHLNLGDATRLGPDGRALFWADGGLNPACWNANGTAITAGACAGANGNRARARSNASFNNVLLAENTNKGSGENLTLSLSRARQDDPWSWSVAYNYSDAREVSPLTSSVAISNWAGRSVFNPNEEVTARSPYVVRDRFVATLGYRAFLFSDNATDFGLFYEGRKGKPYSWTFANDANGDALGGNDLMYIPSGPGSSDVVFRGGAAEEAAFWQIVRDNGLDRFAGQVVDRNSEFSPWTNSFDFRISQQLPGLMDGHKTEIVLDVLNVGNLINKKWGRIDEIGFQGNGAQARSFVNYNGLDAQGRYVYSLSNTVEDFVTRQNRGESQWAAQITLRYRF
jgi:outer membrane receptor protein involved in Fe transport